VTQGSRTSEQREKEHAVTRSGHVSITRTFWITTPTRGASRWPWGRAYTICTWVFQLEAQLCTFVNFYFQAQLCTFVNFLHLVHPEHISPKSISTKGVSKALPVHGFSVPDLYPERVYDDSHDKGYDSAWDSHTEYSTFKLTVFSVLKTDELNSKQNIPMCSSVWSRLSPVFSWKFGCYLYPLQHDSTLKKTFHSKVFFEKWNEGEKPKKNLRKESL